MTTPETHPTTEPDVASPGPLREGELVGGAYRVERQIGSGGMGAVFSAVDERSGARVAVKWVLPGADHARSRERLVREWHLARQVRHPNVVEIFDAGEEPGPQVMKGYWQREEETAKVFDKDGWLHTGDVAKMDEGGFFQIVDRLKDMIIVSGFNVYPNEIESVIAAHPDVLECGVIGVPDKKSGEAVLAVIVKKEPHLNEKDIKDWCRKSLVNYKVPSQIYFDDELPKTNVGKILRRTLRDQYVEQMEST